MYHRDSIYSLHVRDSLGCNFAHYELCERLRCLVFDERAVSFAQRLKGLLTSLSESTTSCLKRLAGGAGF